MSSELEPDNDYASILDSESDTASILESESDATSISESEFDTDTISESEFDTDSASESESEPGRRLAVCFGNNAYQSNAELNSCCKDAKDMEKILKEFGFQATAVLDAKKELMLQVLKEFFKKIRKNDSVLIYYSGHGIEKGGENYFVPIESDSGTKDNVISLSHVMEWLKYRRNKLNIIILDACRSGEKNNDPEKKTYNGMNLSISPKATACSTEQNKDCQQYAVIYGCASQGYSYDGPDSTCNSDFTGALLQCLREKKDKASLSLHEIMFSVTSEMAKMSKQRPWLHLSLFDSFSFYNGCQPFVAIPTLNFNQLKPEKFRFRIKYESSAMAANDLYVLLCSKDNLRLVDKKGKKISKVKRDFDVQDICWSSFQNQFLILDKDKRVYLFNTQTCEYKLFWESKISILSLTCYSQRLVFATTRTIEKYNMIEFKLIKKFRIHKSIEKIRYSSDGNFLGVIVCEDLPKTDRWFELRHSSNLTVLRKIDLGNDSVGLMSLPDKQFLIYRIEKNNFRVINPIDNSEKEISYEQRTYSMALMGDTKHLIIQTTECVDIQGTKSRKLRFYDLTANERRE